MRARRSPSRRSPGCGPRRGAGRHRRRGARSSPAPSRRASARRRGSSPRRASSSSKPSRSTAGDAGSDSGGHSGLNIAPTRVTGGSQPRSAVGYRTPGGITVRDAASTSISRLLRRTGVATWARGDCCWNRGAWLTTAPAAACRVRDVGLPRGRRGPGAGDVRAGAAAPALRAARPRPRRICCARCGTRAAAHVAPAGAPPDRAAPPEELEWITDGRAGPEAGDGRPARLRRDGGALRAAAGDDRRRRRRRLVLQGGRAVAAHADRHDHEPPVPRPGAGGGRAWRRSSPSMLEPRSGGAASGSPTAPLPERARQRAEARVRALPDGRAPDRAATARRARPRPGRCHGARRRRPPRRSAAAPRAARGRSPRCSSRSSLLVPRGRVTLDRRARRRPRAGCRPPGPAPARVRRGAARRGRRRPVPGLGARVRLARDRHAPGR